MRTLFTQGGSNPKTAKSDKANRQFLTMILHLAPAKESGYEVCSSRSAGCTMGCLYTAGRGRMTNTQKARIARTVAWFEQRDEFKTQLLKEIGSFARKCDRLGVTPAIRLNGTSDILWEAQFPEVFDNFPGVTYYDYTKHVKRCQANYALPDNYHLTFSRSEDNDGDCISVLNAGRHNVAVVFRDKNFPETFWDFPTYSADNDDLRFLDPPGGYIGTLMAKGKAKADQSGFVMETDRVYSLPVPQLNLIFNELRVL